VEFGETLHQAGLREVQEETGIIAAVDALIDVYESITEHGHYVMADFSARWLSGEPRAGDDALEAAFFPIEEACRLGRLGRHPDRPAPERDNTINIKILKAI
jgi:8-oxo-dGTP diphosphatase